jgi:hypothetical protein
MQQERLSAEGKQPAVAWSPAYEQSVWLDIRDKTLQIEGDPETPEAFAEAYHFLHVVTVYFKTEYSSSSSPTQKGLWWTVTAEDIKDELEHRNTWAMWDARRRQQTDETAMATEVELAHVLALSYRRLQALEEIGGPEQPEYPVFLHLHEKIREARLAEAKLDQVLPRGREPAPLVSAFLRTPAWKQLYERQNNYNPDSHTNRVIYGKPEDARYGFETIDPFEPHLPETEYERELHFFPNQEQAVAVQYEYQDMGYIVGDVDDYRDNVTITEPWEPTD